MNENSNSKVALVTGGGSGIGRATALAFAREGYKVAVAGRRIEPLNETIKLIETAGGEAIAIPTDLTDAKQVETMVGKVIERFGRLDCAFNNGGSGGQTNWLADFNPEEWHKTIDGYLTSVFLSMKFEIPAILKTGGGAIVNNSSVDGLRAFPFDPAYSAAKHGVLGLTKSAAVQYIQKGVRINAVCPGWILTPPVEEMIARDPGSPERVLMHQPIGRFGKAEEVAEAVLWLCSEKSSMIVGAALPVDGGYVAV